MEITEVRIKLMEGAEDRLRGFCSITFDQAFVVRDLKIIQGNNGPFVAMPSRKLTANCPHCRTKNHLRANYCNHCGERLKGNQLTYDATGRAKLYADIAHPVNARCREMIQNRIVEELRLEVELSKQPGYKSRYDDDYDDELEEHLGETEPGIKTLDSANLGDDARQSVERVDDGFPQVPPPHEQINNAVNESSVDDFGKGIF